MNSPLTIELPVADLIHNFRDEAYFMELCRECSRYGKTWACPPFDFNPGQLLGNWSNALIIAIRIDLPKEYNYVENSPALIWSQKLIFEEKLLEMEKEYGGLAFGFSGGCMRCKNCMRVNGGKCIHPDKVRPALEAFGFNVAKCMKELFGIELEWAENGILPDSLNLVGAFFHNKPYQSIKFRI